MFTYVGLFRVAPIAREHLERTEYFDKIHWADTGSALVLEFGCLADAIATAS